MADLGLGHRYQSAVQLVFCQVSSQRDDFPTGWLRSKQTGYAKEALVLGLGPQLAQDGQASRMRLIYDCCTG